MNRHHKPAIGTGRRTLAAGIVSALALAAPAAFAAPTVWPVSNCNDDGDGSLRAVIGAATTMSGDTVDLSARSDCADSKISVALGEITIAQESLTILGPGSDKLTLDGTNLPGGSTYQNDSRVLTHTGSGTLEIHGLTLYGGHVYHSGNGYKSRGGCVYSANNVALESVDVRNCSVTSLQDEAAGGGIYAKGNATLDNVVVFGNSASGNKTTRGAGIAAVGTITATAGLVKKNSAISPGAVMGAGVSGREGVVLEDTAVVNNTGESSATFTTGGGIYTRYKLALTRAVISGNTAKTTEGSGASAGSGGAFSFFGPVTVSYSTIENNASIGLPSGSDAGGIGTDGNFTMTRSTVSGNSTSGFGGGIVKSQNCANCTPKFYMRDSTVSGNHAGTTVGGVYLGSAPQTFLLNSTIAFNTADAGSAGVPPNTFALAPGLHLSSSYPTSATIHSMIVSNNSYGAGIEADFTTFAGEPITFNPGPANSLIRVTAVEGLPSGVISGACPLLGPLRDNGGLTQTHALASGSPAIDAGDNVLVGFGLAIDLNDQRGSESGNGTATYLRMSGPIDDPQPLPDMGAYEMQQDEIVFNGGFDGCAD